MKRKIPEIPRRCRELAAKIRWFFTHGLFIDNGAKRYIDTVFSDPSPEAVASLLAGESSCEGDSLLALIFFPDLSFQLKIEKLLTHERFVPEDENDVLAKLHETPIQASVHFEVDQTPLKIDVPYWATEQFVRRLNIHKEIDARLAGAIAQYAADYGDTLRVKLRNSRAVLGREHAAFLCEFLAKFTVHDDGFLPCFDFMITLFEESMVAADIRGALTAKKRFYTRCLHRAGQIQKLLEVETMETRMSKGLALPHVDAEDALKKLEIIHRIESAVWDPDGTANGVTGERPLPCSCGELDNRST